MVDARWLRLVPMVGLVGAFVFTNIYEDPANIFHNDSPEIAKELIDGNAVYFGIRDWDERGVKKCLVELMPKNIDCLTIGTSLSMGIRKSHVGSDSYYNLSASGLNFYDILAELGLLELNQIEVGRIIICVDPYFFSDSLYKNGSRNPIMMKYADYMMSVLYGEDIRSPKNDFFRPMKIKFQQALSVTYFQSAIKLIQSNKSYKLPYKRWGILDAKTQDYAHYLEDASLVYAVDYRNHTEDYVLKSSESYNINYQFSKGKHINEHSKEVFIEIIKRLKKQGTEVEFFLCPLAPALWDRIKNEPDADQYYILDEIEEFASKVASEYDLKVTGTYNPYRLGATNADFWDQRHVRHDKLEKFFDFKGRGLRKEAGMKDD